jgi:glycosyltransferase involved in cell wall biosynthesis
MLSNKEVKISILIVTFNRKKYIQEAIKCALAQTYSNFQIMVYDDGSTDGTSDMLALKFPSVIVIRSSKNQGVSIARHNLLEACDTEIACWWDSDDLCNIHRLQIQSDKIREGYGIVFSAYTSFRDTGIPDWQEKPRQIKQIFASASIMFKVDKEIQYQLKTKFGGEDSNWSNLMKQKYRPFYVKEALYYVRYHHFRIGVLKTKATKSEKSMSYADAAEAYFYRTFNCKLTAKEKLMSYADALSSYLSRKSTH